MKALKLTCSICESQSDLSARSSFIECLCCDVLAHPACLSGSGNFCKCCGWFCRDHYIEGFECESCHQLHKANHIISLSGGFVNEIGVYCCNCFYDFDDIKEEGASKPQNSAPKKGCFSNGRADFSFYLSHFIKGNDTDSSCSRLIQIVKDQTIESNSTGYFTWRYPDYSKAVCFTEGKVDALACHASRYSNFGIAFEKEWLIENFSAAPAIYIQENLIRNIKEEIPQALYPFVNKLSLGAFDFHHEREWRVPCDIKFTLENLSMIFASLEFHERIREETKYKGPIYCLASLLKII